ncbi:MAG: TonB-dependent receptor domain-containing protein, partial [Rhodospirillaceae bacterium]
MAGIGSRASARKVTRVHFTKSNALGTVSAAALMISGLLAAGQASAQTAQPAPAQSAQVQAVEEITVTATRIVRDGYEAPTPTTVISAEQIEAAAQTNIADYVSQLPALASSASVRTGNGGSSGGTGGISSSNLRGLGAFRTLVLLDGHRVVGASFSLAPDIGEFPQALISRVDVVTGGASAAWGSDAVAGVVNFVLDKKFVGFKGEVSGSVTTYGDDRQGKITLTGGVPFAADRGHFLISAEHAQSDGVGLATTRPWYQGYKLIPYSIAATPAGKPQFNVLPHVGNDDEAPGGIVTNIAANGPLRGLIFGPGGSVAQYNLGDLDVAPFNSGGDWKMTDIGYVSNLEDSMRKDTVFLRGAFDVADDVNVWIEANYGDVHSRYNCCAEFNRKFVIKSDNAFLPASVAAAMGANKLASITVGNTLGDLGYAIPDNRRIMSRVAVGAEGRVDAFDSTWSWNVYLTRGVNHISNANDNQSITLNINRAVDAVRGANGQIVCRSTLTSPTDGCVPYNVFGIGVNSAAALNWIRGRPELHVKQTQDVGSASFNGEPFSNWAGPISLAGGIEYRKESAVAKNEGPISEGNGYFSGNFHATQGAYHDWEGYLETVFPLAKDTVWAKSFDLNAAVRATDYSLAGYVTTWKVGATYNPIDDIRLRATRSRDIRAPNLSDLFLAGQTNSQTVVDDFAPNAGRTFSVARHTFGNTALKPETADTTG